MSCAETMPDRCPSLRAPWRAIRRSASDATLLAYITVHWLRRQNSAYGRAIASTKHQTGRWEAYYRLRARLLDAISTAYPHLRDECAAQRSKELAPADRSGVTIEGLESLEPDRAGSLPQLFGAPGEAWVTRK
jgi:hypothetical protein